MLTIVSQRNRTWWRNLRGGRPLTIHLQGQDLTASGIVIEDDAGVTSDLTSYLQKNPQVAKYFQVKLDATGQPARDDVARAAKNRVMVRIQLG